MLAGFRITVAIRLDGIGQSEALTPVSMVVWSNVSPFLLSTLRRLSTLTFAFFLSRVTKKFFF